MNIDYEKRIKDLKVTSLRYFETRRGVGYECKTNIPNVTIWNDGMGGFTYFDIDTDAIKLNGLLSDIQKDQDHMESLIDDYEYNKSFKS